MKQSVKRTIVITAIAAVVIATASGVFAGGGYYGPGWGGHHGMMGAPGGMYGPNGAPGGMMGGCPQGYTGQPLADLKTPLGISPDQEGAWNHYVAAVEGRTALMQSHRQAMLTNGPVTPEQHLALRQQGFEQMQQVINARRNLYNILTPQQRIRADELIGW